MASGNNGSNKAEEGGRLRQLDKEMRDSPVLRAHCGATATELPDDLLVKKKELADMKYERAVLLQDRRLKENNRKLEEWLEERERETGVQREECPVCLKPLPRSTEHYDNSTRGGASHGGSVSLSGGTLVRLSSSGAERFPCCGKLLCNECAEDTIRRLDDPNDGFDLTNCFLCRSPVVGWGGGPTFQNVSPHAERGQAWAQYWIGRAYESGIDGVVGKDMEMAIEWYKKAAAQGYTAAETAIGLCHQDGNGVSKSLAEARTWLEKAVLKRDIHAMDGLISNLLQSTEKDESSMHYVDLLEISAAGGLASSQFMLGNMYGDESGRIEGVEYSLELSEYWLAKAAEQENNSFPDYFLAECLLKRAERTFGNANIAGYSAVPRAYALAKRSDSRGCPLAVSLIEKLELAAKGSCAYCGKSGGTELKKCARCKICFYCSKDHQKKAWRSGHKVDCVELKSYFTIESES